VRAEGCVELPGLAGVRVDLNEEHRGGILGEDRVDAGHLAIPIGAEGALEDRRPLDWDAEVGELAHLCLLGHARGGDGHKGRCDDCERETGRETSDGPKQGSFLLGQVVIGGA